MVVIPIFTGHSTELAFATMSKQNTLSLQQKSPVTNLVGLARQIALPHEYAPQRFPSFPALERTAAMGFSSVGTWSVPATGTVKAMLCRQAAWPLWLDQSLTSASDFAFQVSFSMQERNSGSFPVAIVDTNVRDWANTSRSASSTFVGLGGTGSTTPLLPYPIVGLDAASGLMPYVYVPPGGVLSFTASCAAATVLDVIVNVVYERWVSPGEADTIAPTLSFTITGGNRGAFTAVTATGGWYRVTSVGSTSAGSVFPDLVSLTSSMGVQNYTVSTTTRGTVTVADFTGTAFLPFQAPAEFVNSSIPWSSTRITAAAALFTNVTQVLSKGGTALCGRIAPATVNPWEVAAANINTLHPAEKAFLALETGAYTYVPPSTDLTFFSDFVLSVPKASGGDLPLYRLDNDSMINYLFLTSAGVVETMAVTLDWHIEFRTSSALFNVGMSALTLETLHQAQLGLSRIGWFFPNETHKSMIARVAQHLMSYARTILPHVAPFHPVLGAANMLLSAKPKPSPPATSGKASGIVGKPRAKPKPKAKVLIRKKH